MRKILVVDDSPVVRNFHMSILKTSGFMTDGAEDGVQALEKSLSSKFDLILCDLNMPNMDGLTYIRKYREIDTETPIIVVTTQEEAVHRKLGFDAGANLYISKPVGPKELALNIKMLIGEDENEG